MITKERRHGAGAIRIEVQEADALVYASDVLVLKYAQHLYGLDERAAERLRNVYPSIDSELPKPGDFRVYDPRKQLGARTVILLGVLPLRAFGYEQIQQFAKNALAVASLQCPRAESIALTVHGPGYGLDEMECFESLIAGILDQLSVGNFPPELKQIIILENVPRRASRFGRELDRMLESVAPQSPHGAPAAPVLRPQDVERLRVQSNKLVSKPLLFVAMPFRDDMTDHYDYGILNAAERAGFLCERADQAHFTGDILDWVRRRIKAATLVVADLSYANPNVYLEVGYAWGLDKPTVLLVRDNEELKFDVRGQRCLVYKRIKDLEERLYQELLSLNA
jgi:hypothetical protein